MKKYLLMTTLLIGALLKPLAVLAALDDNLSDERRVALVIGNSDYQIAPLQTPVNDARAMAARLQELGFEVILRENASATQMSSALREFGDRLQGGGGVGLFYYAGHGVQIDGGNYLIPVGIDVRREFEVKYSAVNANQVLEEMGHAKNRVNLVILDACRNNPFYSSTRSLRDGLAPLDSASTPTGTLIAFATAPGKVAFDGQVNGIYTKNLLQSLEQPEQPIEQILKRARVGVMKETGGQQIPWESSSLTGDFYFQANASAKLDRLPQAEATSEAQAFVPAKTVAAEDMVRPSHEGMVNWAHQTLAANPNDQGALSVLNTVIDSYLEWAGHYMDQQDLEKSTVMLLRARAIQPFATKEQVSVMGLLATRLRNGYLHAATF